MRWEPNIFPPKAKLLTMIKSYTQQSFFNLSRCVSVVFLHYITLNLIDAGDGKQ